MFADHKVGYLEQGVSTGQPYWEAQSPRDAEIEWCSRASGMRGGAEFLTQKKGFLEGSGSVNF